MFHVELRQFPHTARAFNLSEAELGRRFLAPWTAGQVVVHGDHRFSPEKAKLTVYEGRELATEEIGMGRGWANATRTGEDVTERMLRAAATPQPLERFKAEVQARAAAGVTLDAVLAMASERHPSWRVSDRLALAERAVWELLHQARLEMEGIAPEAWEASLLSTRSWTPEAPVTLRAVS